MEREVEGLKSSVESAVEDLESRLDAETEILGSRGTAASSAVEEILSELNKLNGDMAALLASARTMEVNQQATFGSTQTSNQEIFSSLLAESRDTLRESIDKMHADLDATHEDADVSIKQNLDAATDVKARIEDLYEISAETTLIGNYTRNAGRERTAANRWRIGAIIGAVFAIAVAFWATVAAHAAGTDWDLLTAKALLGSSIASVAAYAARQSSEHRHTERDAEHVAVQLAALKPYLADIIDPQERDQLLIAIAKKLFGHARTGSSETAELAELLTDTPGLLGTILAAST